MRPRILRLGSLLVGAALLGSASPALAYTNAELCRRDIGRGVGVLQRAMNSIIDDCVHYRDYDTCAPTADTFSLLQDGAFRPLHNALTAEDSHCRVAVESDGVALGAIGPTSCPPAFHGCDAIGAIDSLAKLETCLTCVADGYDAKYRRDLDLAPPPPVSQRTATCVSTLHAATAKAIRTALATAAKCAGVAAAPSCAVSDAPGSKVRKALDGIDNKLTAKCADTAPGFVHAAGFLCNRAIVSTGDLRSCGGQLARCLACNWVNTTYRQTQDCSAFSGLGNCDGHFAAFGAAYVTNEADDTVTYLAPGGGYALGSLVTSTFPVGDAPVAVAADAETNAVIVVNGGDQSVTYLNGTTGAPMQGSLAASTFAVGADPVAVVVVPETGIVFVANAGDGTVTLLDALSGSYIYGTLAASSRTVGTAPSALALSPSGNVVAVANKGSDSVTYLNAATGEYQFGTIGESTFPTGGEPSGLAFGQDYLVVTHSSNASVTVLDASTGSPAIEGSLADMSIPGLPGPGAIGGYTVEISDPEFPPYPLDVFVVAYPGQNAAGVMDLHSFAYGQRQRFVATLTQPVAVAHDGFTQGFYVVERGDDSVTLYEAGRDPLSEDGSYPGVVAASAGLNRMYVHDSSELLYLDVTTGLPLAGPYGFSTELGPSSCSVTVNETAGIMYGLQSFSGVLKVTFFNADHPGYTFGSRESSSFAPGPHPGCDLEVDRQAQVLFVLDSGGVVELNAETGAYLYGTLAASTTSLPLGSSKMFVNEDQGILYVLDTAAGSVIYLNSHTGAYLNGTLANSTLTLTPPIGSLVFDSADDLLFVSEQQGPSVVRLRAGSVGFANGNEAGSRITVSGTGTPRLAVETSTDRLYAVTDEAVTYLVASTGAYALGSLPTSSFALEGPAGTPVVNGPGNMLYVPLGSDAGSVIFLDATTGAYRNGSPFKSTFFTSDDSDSFASAAVNPATNLLVVSGAAAMDAQTGWNYVREVSATTTTSTGSSPSAVAVMGVSR